MTTHDVIMVLSGALGAFVVSNTVWFIVISRQR